MDDEARAAQITAMMDRIRGRFEEIGDDQDDWDDAREARNLVVWSLTAALIAKLPDYRDVIAALREDVVSPLVMGPYKEDVREAVQREVDSIVDLVEIMVLAGAGDSGAEPWLGFRDGNRPVESW